MVTPAGVDLVLWQQAVEAAAGKICIEGHEGCLAKGEHLRQAQDALTAALPVLQQATGQQIADQIASESVYAKDGQLFGYALGMERAEVVARTFRVARRETPA